MTQVHTSQIEIRASARQVFEIISDPASLFRGLPIDIRIDVDPPGPVRRGTRLRAVAVFYGQEQAERLNIEVTDFTAPRVIEVVGFLSPKRSRGRSVTRYEIEQFGAVSKLIVTSRVELDSWWIWLSWPVTRFFMDWLAFRQLKLLKAAAEKA